MPSNSSEDLINQAQQRLRWLQEQLLIFLDLKEKEVRARMAKGAGGAAQHNGDEDSWLKNLKP